MNGKAVSPTVRSLKKLVRRYRELLSGSRLDKLRSHRGVLADIMDRAERNAGPLQREFFSLHNSDPLRHTRLTQGKWVGSHDIATDLSYLDLKGPALAEAERVSRELRPRIDAAEKLYDAAMDRFWGASHRFHGRGINLDTGKWVGGIGEQIENEQHAVNAARLISGIGAAGALGGAGYGTYKALSGEKKADAESDGGSALGDAGAYVASAAAPLVAGYPVGRALHRAGTSAVDGKTIARTAVAISRSRHGRFLAALARASGVLGLGGMLYGASGKGSADSDTLNVLSALGAAGVLPTHLENAAAINRHLVRRGIRGLGRLRALSPFGFAATTAAAPHLSAFVRRSIDKIRKAKRSD